MAKILLLAIAVWLVITVLKRYFRNLGLSTGSANEADKLNPESEDMVQCAHCGIHLPASDSLLVDNRHYCCEAHSIAGHNASDHDHGN